MLDERGFSPPSLRGEAEKGWGREKQGLRIIITSVPALHMGVSAPRTQSPLNCLCPLHKRHCTPHTRFKPSPSDALLIPQVGTKLLSRSEAHRLNVTQRWILFGLHSAYLKFGLVFT